MKENEEIKEQQKPEGNTTQIRSRSSRTEKKKSETLETNLSETEEIEEKTKEKNTVDHDIMGTGWDGNTRRSLRSRKPIDKFEATREPKSKREEKFEINEDDFDQNDIYYSRSLRTRKNTVNYDETIPKPAKRGRKKMDTSSEEEEEEVEEETEEETDEEFEDEEEEVVSIRGKSKRKDESEEESEEEYEEEVRAPKNNKGRRGRKKKVEEDEMDVEEDDEQEEIQQQGDDDEDDDEEEDEEDEIEKILAWREEVLSSEEENEGEKKEKSEKETVVEYLIKYKDKSYLHVEWLTADEICSQPDGKSKLNRFEKKFGDVSFDYLDGEYFNPDYCVPERILNDTTWKKKRCFFVKWKGLSYTDATWEFEEIITDKSIVERYDKFKSLPKEKDRLIPPKPDVTDWKKLEESPIFKNGNQLREYQLEGLNWLLFCYYHGRNSCLADEMGLGKTVQTVSIIEALRTNLGNRGPYLIVAPLSTIGHWQREFQNWTDNNVVVLHGSQESRKLIYQYDFYYFNKRGRPIPGIYKFNVLITTYEIALAESSTLSKINWQYLAVDEGHRLKNKKSKLLETLFTFKTAHKLLLSGTPIQNDIKELWTLLHFLEPKKFDDVDDFMDEYGKMSDSTHAKKLHDLVEPYLLRRLKEDVEKSIPPKEEIIVEVVPTTIQKKYYRAIIDRNREFLQGGSGKKSDVPSLVNILMELRKICNHPFLLKGVESQLTEGMKDNEINELMVRCSSKLLLVDKLLTKLREGKHRVLIFSQMVKVLHILEDYMNYKKFPYERLDGSIRGDERQEAIDRFSDMKKDNFNTKEKEMFERASMKLGLDRAILNMEGGDIFEGKSSKKESKIGLNSNEIDTLLKYGAYSAFKKDSEEDEKLLLEGDIESILERSSTVIKYDQIQSEKGVSQFSKASFCFEQSDLDVDINDKNFWDKVLPENRTAEALLRKLQSGSSLKSKEQREQFMKDLENIVNQHLESFQKFKHKDSETLNDLLVQLIYSLLFEKEHRDKAANWETLLQGRRGGREVRIESESDNDNDDEEGIPVDENETESRKSVKRQGWFKAERQRFQKSFLEFGWGKWEKIKEQKLTHHTLQDIHSFAECFIFQTMKYSTEEDQTKFLNSVLHSASVPDSATDAENDEQKTLETSLTDKVNAGNQIYVTLPVHDEKCRIEFIEIAPESKKETKKEVENEEEIKEEKEEIFGNRCIRLFEISSSKKEDKYELIAPGYDGKFFVRCIIGDQVYISRQFEIEGCHPLLEDEEWTNLAKRGVKNWCKKLKFTQDLSSVFKIYDELQVSNIPGLAIKKPAPFWDAECDKDLLEGARLHGYGKMNEFKDDKNLCFEAKFDDYISSIKSSREKKVALESWPTQALLNKRATKLIEKILQAHKHPKLTIKSKKVKSTTSTNVEEWSKREKQDLQRTLVQHGLYPDSKGIPQYEKIISNAKLRKTVDATSTYIQNFLEECEKVYLDSEKKKQDEKVDKKKEDKMETEEEDTEKKTDDKKKEDDAVTPLTSKKVLERVRVMEKIYQFVYPQLEEMKAKLKYLSDLKGLPKWWDHNCDYDLLVGIKTHGFDFKSLFADQNYRFKNENTTEKKNALPREGICMSRLEKIYQLFEKMIILGDTPSPSPKEHKSNIVFKTPPKHMKNDHKNDDHEEEDDWRILVAEDDELEEEKKSEKPKKRKRDETTKSEKKMKTGTLDAFVKTTKKENEEKKE
eukprot:gene8691-638_t